MSDETPQKKKGDKRRDFGSIVKRGDVFYARWTERGRLHWKAIGKTKTLAERFLAKRRTDIDQAEALGIRPVNAILFEDLLKEYGRLFSGQKASVTVTRDESYLRSIALKHFGGMKADAIRTEDVERFLTGHIERGNLSGATRNRILSLLSSLFRRAVRNNYMRENPCKDITRGREFLKDVPFVPLEDQEKIISCLDGPLRHAAQLTMDTGLRLGELLRLDWQDISMKERALTVRIAKNKKPRTIPFGAWGYEALVAQQALRGDHPHTVPDPVFPTITHLTRRTGEADFSGVARKGWNAARVRAGYPKLRWHDLRHVFATTAVRAGVPLTDVSQLLGHSSLVMSLRYARHAPANFKQEARALMERFRGGEGNVRESRPA